MLPLFDDPPATSQPALAKRLGELAKQGIYFGTSSWKYEGWLGSIYTPERYYVRGKFSKKRFDELCLREYAETFPVVCGDFSFYTFPTEVQWRSLFSNTPESLRFAFKVPEEITVRVFPAHPRYGGRAGAENPHFLSAQLFTEQFLRLLQPYRRRVSLLIFEFGAFPRNSFRDPNEFADQLDGLLQALPQDYRYAVEIRNMELLTSDHFAVLRAHHCAHVFNAWTRMPELSEQIAMPDAFTTDFTVARALLRKGRAYEDAVQQFTPYRSVQEVNEEARSALRSLMSHARQHQQEAFLFVNNRLEGHAPGTIEAVVEE